ncbi:MAG TPA: endolytic transglycosylase MltG [Gammaproteobacteria bacterium]|jgi:UPF0755 protein|nr:endolytic transglycosylase MltG [Gammaproteobacteria bacterium]
MKAWVARHRIATTLIALVFLVFLTLTYNLFRAVTVPRAGFVYYVEPGASKDSVALALGNANVLPHPYFFLQFANLHTKTDLKTGEYLIRQGTSVHALWRQLSRGTGHYYRAFTIVPGWTFAQVRRALEANPYMRHTSTLMDDDNLMALMSGKPMSPEGQFLPETYFYQRNDVDVSVLKRAYALMQFTLNQAWQMRDVTVPYQSPYEALIAASLVEREAYLASERPVIAGVLINRLNQHMRLQFDPTVIFGMGDRYQGKITKADLREDTPYNTYVHAGLPPTPIAMPSASTINAALHPLHHDYLYFVARGDGSHQFSKTLIEHNAAVQNAILRKSGLLENHKIQNQIESLLTGNLNILIHPQHRLM